jgi:hypothetical protein
MARLLLGDLDMKTETQIVRYVGNNTKMAGMEGEIEGRLSPDAAFAVYKVKWKHTFGETIERGFSLKPIRGYSKAFR